jgi:hypothetical protein
MATAQAHPAAEGVFRDGHRTRRRIDWQSEQDTVVLE